MKAELILNSLMYGNFETVMKGKFKWLGQILCTKVLADSVGETMLSRGGKIRGACLEFPRLLTTGGHKFVGGRRQF